jgi:transcriptional regulator with XRE-family HTH domain
MVSMNTLMDELQRIQQDRGWSDRRMSRELGVSHSAYNHLKTGRMKAGRKVLGGVARAFPWVDVKFFVAQDVDSKGHAGNGRVQ